MYRATFTLITSDDEMLRDGPRFLVYFNYGLRDSNYNIIIKEIIIFYLNKVLYHLVWNGKFKVIKLEVL